MKTIRMSNQFIRDLKRIKKRGKLLSKLDMLVELLTIGKKLDVKIGSINFRAIMEAKWNVI